MAKEELKGKEEKGWGARGDNHDHREESVLNNRGVLIWARRKESEKREAGGPDKRLSGLGGVQEAIEGVVGRLQVEEHLPHLRVIQLIRGRHAAQSG